MTSGPVCFVAGARTAEPTTSAETRHGRSSPTRLGMYHIVVDLAGPRPRDASQSSLFVIFICLVSWLMRLVVTPAARPNSGRGTMSYLSNMVGRNLTFGPVGFMAREGGGADNSAKTRRNGRSSPTWPWVYHIVEDLAGLVPVIHPQPRCSWSLLVSSHGQRG